MTRKLTLDDILEPRAYERERRQFLTHIIDLKRRRRVEVGTIVSVTFETVDTVRFQIQEMARAERILTDAGIDNELRAYNPLIPEPGQLCATMFIELTSEEMLREWLPRLVGVERTVEFVLPSGDVVAAILDEDHAEHLTREETTSAVHFLRWEFTADQVEDFASGEPVLRITHPAYAEETSLAASTIRELLGDLRP